MRNTGTVDIPDDGEGPGSELAQDVERFRDLMLSTGRRRTLRDPIATACEAMSLSPVQLHSLLWLGHDGALTMGELSRRVGITEKTVTGVVDRLEEAGYLHRERDTADRRVVRVRLAPPGDEAYRRIERRLTDHMRTLLGRLAHKDRTDLLRLLEKLLAEPGQAHAERDCAREESK
jgi:DNA-binding MarR family transcriptional regulator